MIGRVKELKILNDLYKSDQSQFVAVCGRRRVGKTFLINGAFDGLFTFKHSGLSPVENGSEMDESPYGSQLRHFYNSLKLHGAKVKRCPEDWLEAFFQLELFLQSIDDGKRQVVFIDELPWMDTPRSGFITALEAFWNGWGCSRKNLMLIVCGSATSWMNDKLINNHGGLYGRLTRQIFLEPFTLKECEEFFAEKEMNFSRYDITCAYMACGGVPYYLNYFSREASLTQNIDALFFGKNAPLNGEFDRLFGSAFANGDYMKALVRAIARKRCGCTRNEIISAMGASSSGDLSKSLKALIASDFVVKYAPFGERPRQKRYKLIDPFCDFYLRFVENSDKLCEGFWLASLENQSVAAWRGLAFENVCFNHIKQIKKALGISGVGTEQFAWSKFGDEQEGAQIDMVIKRKDNIANMCEIKFYSDDVAIDKKMDLQIRNRSGALLAELPKSFGVMNTLITTYGVKEGCYRWVFQNVITLDDLFED